jgi:phosphate transport system ATP-binding protein
VTATARAVPRPAPVCLCAEGVGVRYGGELALEGVSLEFGRGRIAALMGPSGCGKSSFLLCLNRLIELVPGAEAAGRVELEGEDVHARGADVVALRRRVGMVFQRPNPFPQSIRRNFEVPLRAHGVRDRRRVADIMERTLRDVGLWEEVRDRLDRSALGLSGGQQQRLCIARALALEPEVLLMDEPCSALDPLSSAVVEDLIASFRGRYTVIVVTHNLAQARRIADDAALFWADAGVGRLVEGAPAAELFERPRHPLTAAYISGARG